MQGRCFLVRQRLLGGIGGIAVIVDQSHERQKPSDDAYKERESGEEGGDILVYDFERSALQI